MDYQSTNGVYVSAKGCDDFVLRDVDTDEIITLRETGILEFGDFEISFIPDDDSVSKFLRKAELEFREVIYDRDCECGCSYVYVNPNDFEMIYDKKLILRDIVLLIDGSYRIDQKEKKWEDIFRDIVMHLRNKAEQHPSFCKIRAEIFMKCKFDCFGRARWETEIEILGITGKEYESDEEEECGLYTKACRY